MNLSLTQSWAMPADRFAMTMPVEHNNSEIAQLREHGEQALAEIISSYNERLLRIIDFHRQALKRLEDGPPELANLPFVRHQLALSINWPLRSVIAASCLWHGPTATRTWWPPRRSSRLLFFRSSRTRRPTIPRCSMNWPIRWPWPLTPTRPHRFPTPLSPNWCDDTPTHRIKLI